MPRLFAELLNPHFGYVYTVKESLYKGKTAFQDLEIIDTEEFGRVMLLDEVTQVGEKNEFLYHEPMVHPALTSHPNPQSILVIGAGDGGIVRECLKHNPERVVHCELDGGVVDICKEYLPSINGGCWDDPRVDLQICDGRQYIEDSEEVFDVIIMDMTDPFGPSTMLYTKEFFTAVSERLGDDNGLFVMHAESTITRPQAFQQINNTLAAVWPTVNNLHLYIQMYSTLWSIAVASKSDIVATTPANTLAQRLADRNVGTLAAYTPASHHAMQVGFPFIDVIREEGRTLPIITDAASTFIDECDLNSQTSGTTINKLLNP